MVQEIQQVGGGVVQEIQQVGGGVVQEIQQVGGGVVQEIQQVGGGGEIQQVGGVSQGTQEIPRKKKPKTQNQQAGMAQGYL